MALFPRRALRLDPGLRGGTLHFRRTLLARLFRSGLRPRLGLDFDRTFLSRLLHPRLRARLFASRLGLVITSPLLYTERRRRAFLRARTSRRFDRRRRWALHRDGAVVAR